MLLPLFCECIKIDGTRPSLMFWGRYEHVRHTSTMLQSLVDNTMGRLEAWKADLPPELQINLDDETAIYLPHVILLQYVAAICSLLLQLTHP